MQKLSYENMKVFGLYVLLITGIYAQVVFFGKSLMPSLYYPKAFALLSSNDARKPMNTFNIDLATPAFYEVPINKYIGDVYKSSEIPLWNPYQGCGVPLVAQYSTRALFPYQIAEDISPYWAWDYFILGRLILAGFFTYLLLRLIGIGIYGAFLGGVLYALSGSFVWFINLEQFTNVVMMVPVCFYSMEKYLKGNRYRWLALSAISIGMMIIAGQPEISIYVILLLSVYYIFRMFMVKEGIIKKLLNFVLMFILGLGLSSVLILPFLEYIPNAYQCHPLGGNMGTLAPALLMIAIGLIVPSFFELGTYWRMFPHNGAWDSLGGYAGILVSCLILLGFFYKSKVYKKYFIFFSLFGIFIILKNFGFPLISWIGRLPLLDQSWSPRWSGGVWAFCLSCAGGIGLEIIQNDDSKNKIKPLAVLFLLFCAVIFLAYQSTYFLQLKNLDVNQFKAVVIPIFGGLIVSVLVILAVVFLILRVKNKKHFGFAVILLGIFELWFYIPKGAGFPWDAFKLVPFLIGIATLFLVISNRWRLAIAGFIIVLCLYIFIDIKSPYGFPERHNIFRETKYIKFLKENLGIYRIFAGEGILVPNFASVFKLFDLRYIVSLSPLAYQNYADKHLLTEPHNRNTDRLWFTGVSDPDKNPMRSSYEDIMNNFRYYCYLGIKYIITSKDTVSQMRLVYDDEVRIYENSNCAERIYVARNIIYKKGYKEAQDVIKDANFDLKKDVVLEEKPPLWYGQNITYNGNDKIEVKEYRNNRVKIVSETGADGILVLTDVHYPGWKVSVDGRQDKIYRVNGLVRGVFLKKGKHEIIFRYDPISFKIGVLMSGICLVVCFGFIVRDKKR